MLIWHVREAEIFSHRRKVEFLSDASTEARPLINKLSFVTNTAFRALLFQKGYVEIAQRDFQTLREAMKAR
jgi:hypothetical protein